MPTRPSVRYDLAFAAVRRIRDAANRTAVQQPLLQPVRLAFIENAERLCVLCELPAFTFAEGELKGHVETRALFEVTGKPYMVSSASEPPPFEILEAKRDELLKDYQQGRYRLRFAPRGQQHAPDRALATAMNAEATFDANPKAFMAVEALYRAALISGWTIFETAASDAWESAVNDRPNTLGRRAFDAQVKDEDASDGTRAVRAIPEARLPDLLKEHGMNLSAVMGTVVRRERTGAFNRFHGLKAYYVAAFESTARGLFDVHRDVAHLEALRNLLVHRGGLVDRQFASRVKNEPDLAALPIGTQLSVTADMMVKYTEAALRAGTNVLQFVDSWLTRNQP